MSTTIESLELEIQSNSANAVKGIDALTQSLAKLKNATKGGLGLSAVAKETGKVNDAMNKLTASNNKTKASFSDVYTQVKLVTKGIKALVSGVWSAIEKSTDYTENMNLFSVSMGKYANTTTNAMGETVMGAKEYAEIVSNAMGIDTSDWIRSQGVFMTLATGFGVAGDRAAIMSKNLTQLGYDLASFYNIKNVDDAMAKLKSGLAGELEPLRAIGYDLSQAKLEATALELGIDKSVSSMTQAEKAQLRYYAIMTQVTTAHGDMARTLNDPANQIRVLKSEFNMAAREIGNIFIPALNAILPYVTAVTKVVRLLASTIASLVGYEIPEVDYSGVSAMGNAATDTSDAMGEATEEAKKLKNYMLGFDELNVINPGESASSDNASDGFDFNLPEYDFLKGLTESNVAEIVEEMKEWLGLTEDIDSWAELFDTRLGKILTTVGLIGGAFSLWKIGSGVSKGISAITSLFGKKDKGGIGDIGGAKGITSPKTILKGLANVAIIVGGVIALVAAIGLLTKIPGFNDVMSEGLSALATVFKGLLPALIPIALVSAGMVVIGKTKVSQVAKGLANTAIIVGGTTVLITAIGALMSIPYFSEFLSTGITSVVDTFNGLYEIAIPIGILSAYMVVIGLISPATIALGLAGFAIVIGGTVALVTAIGALLSIPGFSDFLSTGITSLKDTFNGLYEIAEPIGVLSAYLIVLGIATPATILSGLAGFALVIGGFTAILVALGALKQIEGFDWIVDEGAEVLKKLGSTLGEFAGSIVGGFAEGVTDSFPKIGENLAEFMENAEPFIEGLEGVDEKSLTGVKNLAAMVLLLTAADVLNGLTSWMTGGNSLGKFGEQLPSFGTNMKKYSDNIKGLDPDAVVNSTNAAKSIVEIAKNIPNSGGVVSWFTGENNIESFGKMLPSFGTNMKKYSDNVKGLDADVVKNSTNAAESVVSIAKNIPNSGGVAAWFAGNNDIDVWGAKLPSFGKNFKKYSDNVKGLDKSVVDNTTAAAKSMVALCREIPNSGGVASWFTGDNDIADFGGKLAIFGVKFKEYYDSIKGLSITTLNNITDCIGRIIDFSIRIKNEVDTKKVDSFTDAIKRLGRAIDDLPTSKTITITVNQVNNSTEIDSVADAIGKLPLFASGGFPEQGQMFIAREAGAEMVGSIGRRTAVANNDQIVTGIANGVAEANGEQNALLREQNTLLRAILEKDGGVYLDGKSLTKSVEKYQHERGRVLITGGVM